MRNLMEYPITEAEIIDTLNGIATGLDALRVVGDVRPLCLRAAAEIVQAAGDMLRAIDGRLDQKPGSVLRYVTPWKEATALSEAFHKTTPPAATEAEDVSRDVALRIVREFWPSKFKPEHWQLVNDITAALRAASGEDSNAT